MPDAPQSSLLILPTESHDPGGGALEPTESPVRQYRRWPYRASPARWQSLAQISLAVLNYPWQCSTSWAWLSLGPR